MQTPAKNWVGRQALSGQGRSVSGQAGLKKSGQFSLRDGLLAGRRQVLRALLAGAACAAVAPQLLALPGDAVAGKQAWPVRRQTQLFMGTMVSITVAGVDNSLADEAMGRAFALGRQLEAVYSRFDSGSPVSLLNSQGRLNDAPPSLLELLAGAERISQATAGLFDVTVLPLLKLDLPKQPESSKSGMAGMAESGSLNSANGGIEAWTSDLSNGYSPDLTNGAAARDLKAASELVGYQKLVCQGRSVSLARSGMGITLDGIAKGHVANAMSDLLTSLGCPNHLVNAGGDIVSSGFRGTGQPWRVGVADPLAPSRHLDVLDLPAKSAVATSGIGLTSPAGRHIVRPGHASDMISNTSSLGNSESASASLSVNAVTPDNFALASTPASATVLAPDGLSADALATALCLLPTSACLSLIETMPGCACCLVSRDGGVVRSSRWVSVSG